MKLYVRQMSKKFDTSKEAPSMKKMDEMELHI